MNKLTLWRDGLECVCDLCVPLHTHAEQAAEVVKLAVAHTVELIKDALGKQSSANGGKAADLIALNAGAALYVAGCADSINEGIAMAQDAIGAGLARAKLTDLATFTQVQQDA